MSYQLGALVGVMILLAQGCGGFLGVASGMKDTKINSEEGNYGKLVAAAETLGWATKRGTGARESIDDWDLTVTPAEGQKVIFTRNNLTAKISFNCTGGPLDDTDACIEAANRLLKPLGYIYP